MHVLIYSIIFTYISKVPQELLLYLILLLINIRVFSVLPRVFFIHHNKAISISW